MDNVESRRKFLKKAAYAAPVVLALGGLSLQADSHGSSLNSGPKGNNGHGNGDDNAPGGSLFNNNAENATAKKGKK